VIHSLLYRHSAIVGVAMILSLSSAHAAQVPNDDLYDSPAGNYLAARHAGVERDASTAANYYLKVLKTDPRNPDLLSRAFLSVLTDGDIEQAAKLADKILQIDHSDRIARLVVGVRAIKQRQYAVARQNFSQSVHGPVTDLTAALLSAWAYYGSGDARAAISEMDKLSGPDWYGIFKDLHAGLILDLANDKKEAGKRYESAYKVDPTALRTVEAYGSWLARSGQIDAARKVYSDFNTSLPNHPLILSEMSGLGAPGSAREANSPPAEVPADVLLKIGSRGDDVKYVQTKLGVPEDGIFGRQTQWAVRKFQGRYGLKPDGVVGPVTSQKLNLRSPIAETAQEKRTELAPAPLVASADAGAAEALYGIGASIGRRGGEDLALVYLQLALYLEPSHVMALLSLADLYETLKKPDLAIKVYERVPTASPLALSAETQLAVDLDTLDRTDEAKKRLDAVIAGHPKDTEALMALGNIERVRKDFAACAASYSKAIDTIPKLEKSNWVVFYFRGICYERAHQWPSAEADMKKALELFPDQPLVLNYLGYSWVDQGVHLEEGMDMIRRAVEQRPDDGYIVDSLGWAYYRTSNYEEAVKNLERAVLLKPDDPTINDHLGDAYWRVGRTLEAHFQWSQAKDFKPDDDELATIEKKLKEGLPPDTASSADAIKTKKAGNGG
jgi:tetratricopeptide (TPR) repeat protein